MRQELQQPQPQGLHPHLGVEFHCSGRPRIRGDAGEATIEFLAVVMILVVPVFYLIIVLGELQGAVYASEAAARGAARIVANDIEHEPAARAQVGLTFADYGGHVQPCVAISCEPRSCPPVSGNVHVTVDVDVPLPLLPDWLAPAASIPVRAHMAMPISGVKVE